MRVCNRILPERTHASKRDINVAAWDLLLLRDAMRQYRALLPRRVSRLPVMKKIKQPIIHAKMLDAKLVNTISKKIGFRPPEFVSEQLEPLDSFEKFHGSQVRNGPSVGQPIDHRRSAFQLSAVNDFNLRHSKSPLFT